MPHTTSDLRIIRAALNSAAEAGFEVPLPGDCHLEHSLNRLSWEIDGRLATLRFEDRGNRILTFRRSSRGYVALDVPRNSRSEGGHLHFAAGPSTRQTAHIKGDLVSVRFTDSGLVEWEQYRDQQDRLVKVLFQYIGLDRIAHVIVADSVSPTPPWEYEPIFPTFRHAAEWATASEGSREPQQETQRQPNDPSALTETPPELWEVAVPPHFRWWIPFLRSQGYYVTWRRVQDGTRRLKVYEAGQLVADYGWIARKHEAGPEAWMLHGDQLSWMPSGRWERCKYYRGELVSPPKPIKGGAHKLRFALHACKEALVG